MAQDYYTTLGVEHTATDDEIKKAYRKKAHQYHPDKSDGNEAKFKEVNEAYQVLGNSSRRQQYDQYGSAFDPSQGSGWPGGFGTQGGPQAGGFQQGNIDFEDLGDILGGVFGFGGRGRSRATRTQRGNDIETTISVSFDEAYSGTEKELSLYMNMPCKTCSGSGAEPSAGMKKCSACNGAGKTTTARSTFFGNFQTESICNTCEGVGELPKKKCTQCRGSKIEKKYNTVKISIPAGIDDTRTIRLSGKGEAAVGAGPAGDLYIHVAVDVSKKFKRQGDDITSREEVPLSTLINGGTAEVATPTGKAKLKIPAQTPSGKIFILHGKGFERLSANGRGDQHVTIHAKIPKKLTQVQKKMLTEFEASFSSDSDSKSWWS